MIVKLPYFSELSSEEKAIVKIPHRMNSLVVNEEGNKTIVEARSNREVAILEYEKVFLGYYKVCFCLLAKNQKKSQKVVFLSPEEWIELWIKTAKGRLPEPPTP